MTWEDKVRRVVPYVAGEQPKARNIIKLNTNECPYPPSPAVQIAAAELEEEYERLRLYPDMDAQPLAQMLAQKYGVTQDQVFVGVGSDDVLAMSFMAFFSSGGTILFPDITYSFYDVWAQLFRIPYRQIPLRDDFTIDEQDYIPGAGKATDDVLRADAQMAEGNAAEKTGDAGAGSVAEDVLHTCGTGLGGIIIANPNAPTGIEMPQDKIEKIIAANQDCVVIVDEAYVDFGAASALPLLEKYENLLVVQTFSKSRAMAGLRVGFAIGNEKLIRYLKDVKFSFNSYTMNLPSIAMGVAAVKDDAYFRSITGRIIETRETFKASLREMGFEFPDSKTNFVFAKHPDFSGSELFAALRERSIIVRHWNRERISDYLRITIGTPEQMREVTRALKEIVKFDKAM